jgi:PAS domain S-box-containing protein
MDIPVIYLTAYADPPTLERAKITEAFGYVLKPFEERDLHTAIEMALYKHRAERRVRESERWLAATLESVDDGVIATDAQGRVKSVNPMARALTGWTQQDILGQDAGVLLRFLDAETRAALDNPLAEALATGATVLLPASALLVARNGVETPVDASAVPIPGEDGEPWGAVLVIRDVRERVRAQEVLKQYVVDLEEKNEELDAFARTVAHDINSPLSIVVSCAQLLERAHADMPAEQLETYLGMLSQVSLKTCNIVKELLLLAAVGNEEVKAEPLDMSAIVAEANKRLTYSGERAEAQITVPDTWPHAVGYGPWVEEVWINYLSNGVKYGGRPPELELGADAPTDGTVRFWVRDNGAGIEPEDQARLFTPFTKLRQVRAKGHGLGLSIVRRIVEKLNGQVGVESVVGQGSVFWFTLPAAQQA